MNRSCPAAFLAAVHVSAALAASPEIKTSFDFRLRYEGFDTPSRSAAADTSYGFSLGRARLGLDASWQRWKLHGMVQAAGVVDLPHNGAFAAGTSYMAANGGDDDPAEIGIAELAATYVNGGFRTTLGRQPYADGNEVPTGVAYLDGVKKRLLSDRLIGVFEWPNVGRRFDGASFAYGRGSASLSGFALRPLTGAFDHKDAFEELDGVSVYGLTLAGKYGAWIPGSELRFFTIRYQDDRPVARRLAGGDLTIDTAGASFLYGNAAGHVLLWGALQRGDWGASGQQAWAYVVNAGRNFSQLPGKPMVHLGLEQSSGDGPGGDHGTFFNLLPTNHKYYGVMDYVDFSNLRDAYFESVISVEEKVKVRAAVHDFALSERADAWYGGSGAFQEASFGYSLRMPAAGRYRSQDLGREADLEITWSLPEGLQLGVGGGRFWGGRAAEAFLPIGHDGSWTYVELSWKR
ncbi:MAG TPA: alginate export family protein [Thermoanaerobaculia bacterium]|jgi:hypothetical protein